MDSFEGGNRKFAYEIYTDEYTFISQMQKVKPEITKPTLLEEHEFERPLLADPRVDYLLTARTSTGEFVQKSAAGYGNMA